MKFKKKTKIKTQKKLIEIFEDNSLRLGKDSYIVFNGEIEIGSNIIFKGKNYFETGNKIESNCSFQDASIGKNNNIKLSSIINQSKVDNNNIIGPFCYIRDNSLIKNNCIVAAFVEVVRSTFKNYSSASHRAFVGDAVIGSRTIIGAGVIFCNYSFKTLKKEKCIIGNDCKIGSNTVIISPFNIKSKKLIPAGQLVKKGYIIK